MLFPPAGKGAGVGVVALVYSPFAASCSCHLCFSIRLYQGLGVHMGELNKAIFSVQGGTVCQAHIATSLSAMVVCVTPSASIPYGFACDLTNQVI